MIMILMVATSLGYTKPNTEFNNTFDYCQCIGIGIDSHHNPSLLPVHGKGKSFMGDVKMQIVASFQLWWLLAFDR